MDTRDIIVIGSSMGGVEALSSLVSQLPADLPASVFVAQHVSEDSPGVLSEILQRKGALRAVNGSDGMPIERGCIYVAPPDRHLLATTEGVRVVFGARENRSRPAIDPLFRTAAVHFGSRVIGVVLTGMLSDGAAGLYAVQRCGGAAVVQSPDDAAYPEMPRNALDRVSDAHVIPLARMGALIDRLSRQAAPRSPEVPEALRIEARLTERTMGSEDRDEVPGTPTQFTCPECSGAIKEIDEDGRRRYRCRVGHAYSPDDMLLEKTRAFEDTLWMALQTLEERAAMLATLAAEDRSRGHARNASSYESRTRETREHAQRLRDLLKSLAA